MSSARKRVIISACLLGEQCRYDGKTKEVNAVIDAFKDYEIVPFCPEAPLFGTPRERISVVEVDGQNRIVTDSTQKDVTSLLEDEINSFMQLHKNIDRIILKSKSPSCGYETTPILNDKNETLKLGSGIAASMFEKHYKDVKIESELDF
ncbi:DUF523 domain-containing protein [Sulfurimonas aquatica]|uniref:DUF523 domain-containing protein n=1 Tax=Sulfurimonas aquatica TaxID=2672570 RepID=A0A975B1Z2_9BACT|nr:DUF523 domain-containing protein [Sulfurimonas aquatica]QSZ42747.1 DUF523 domain-containing protein [Sulfurimonas aquatica]